MSCIYFQGAITKPTVTPQTALSNNVGSKLDAQPQIIKLASKTSHKSKTTTKTVPKKNGHDTKASELPCNTQTNMPSIITCKQSVPSKKTITGTQLNPAAETQKAKSLMKPIDQNEVLSPNSVHDIDSSAASRYLSKGEVNMNDTEVSQKQKRVTEQNSRCRDDWSREDSEDLLEKYGSEVGKNGIFLIRSWGFNHLKAYTNSGTIVRSG